MTFIQMNANLIPIYKNSIKNKLTRMVIAYIFFLSNNKTSKKAKAFARTFFCSTIIISKSTEKVLGPRLSDELKYVIFLFPLVIN